MSTKSKGINAERNLLHLFWGKGISCVRVAGSGSSRYPSPDLIAGNHLRKFAIECKMINDNKKYLDEEGINQLKLFSNIFGAEAWIALKFKKTDWLFISMDDLKKTGKCYAIDVEEAKSKGILFDELTKDL